MPSTADFEKFLAIYGYRFTDITIDEEFNITDITWKSAEEDLTTGIADWDSSKDEEWFMDWLNGAS